MRKELLTSLQVLVAHLAYQAGGIDVQQEEILPSAESLVGDPQDLMSVGAVDESFSRQGVRRV